MPNPSFVTAASLNFMGSLFTVALDLTAGRRSITSSTFQMPTTKSMCRKKQGQNVADRLLKGRKSTRAAVAPLHPSTGATGQENQNAHDGHAQRHTHPRRWHDFRMNVVQSQSGCRLGKCLPVFVQDKVQKTKRSRKRSRKVLDQYVRRTVT